MLTSLKHTFLYGAELRAYERLKPELMFPPAAEGGPEVLIDICDTFCECMEQLAFARYCAEQYKLRPATYVPGFTPRRRAIHRLLGQWTNLALSRGYRMARAHGMSHGLDAGIIDAGIMSRAQRDLRAFLSSAYTKEQVLSYELLGVQVGVAVYDTFLRETMQPTLDLASPDFCRIAYEAFLILRATERYFGERDVRVVILGHCVYNNWKILSDYARARGAQVFVTYNSRAIPLHDVNANRGLLTTDHTPYKREFASLPHDQQEACRAAGEQLLLRRLSGELDHGLSYMSKSPYSGNDRIGLSLDDSKKAIVVMLHSFVDSPHIYEHMVFADFLDWVHHTLDACRSPDLLQRCQILVKPHPNRFPAEDALIERFMADYPFAKLIPPETSNSAIAQLRPACVVTVYGSVAPEFSYQGIPVITCGDNPCSAFGFTFQARTKEEYRSLLISADSLRLTPQQITEVGEFMYMHYMHKQSTRSDYPFERSTPHGGRKGYERIHDFQFAQFRHMVNERMFEMHQEGYAHLACSPRPSPGLMGNSRSTA